MNSIIIENTTDFQDKLKQLSPKRHVMLDSSKGCVVNFINRKVVISSYLFEGGTSYIVNTIEELTNALALAPKGVKILVDNYEGFINVTDKNIVISNYNFESNYDFDEVTA